MRSNISTSNAAVVFKGGKASLVRATIFNDSFTTWITVSPIFPVFWWLTGTIVGGSGRSGVLQEGSTCADNWENWGMACSESNWWLFRSSGTDWVDMGNGWLDGKRLRKMLRILSLFRGVWGFKDINESSEAGLCGFREGNKVEGAISRAWIDGDCHLIDVGIAFIPSKIICSGDRGLKLNTSKGACKVHDSTITSLDTAF